MKLTEEQFSHAMAAFGCTEGPAVGETRGRVRVPMGTKGTIIPCSDAGRGELTTVVVLNLSENGVGILNAVQMRAGQIFIFRVPATPVERPMAIQCSVMYSQNIAGDMYAVGAQFVRVISLRQEAAGDQCMAPNPEELASSDAAHVREVEARLSRLSL